MRIDALLCFLGVVLYLAPGGGAQDPADVESRAEETEESKEEETEESMGEDAEESLGEDADEEPGFDVVTTTMPEECDRKSATTDMLTIDYTGALYNTAVTFDSSRSRSEPFTFQLGVGQVMKGWDMGLKDMCVGETRKLIIPSQFGYGDEQVGDVPPGSTLMFEVELIDIEDGRKPEDVFAEIDEDADGGLSKEELVAWFQKGAERQATDDEEERKVLLEGDKIAEVAESIMREEDKDMDGFLTWSEVKNSWKHDEL